MKFYLKDIGDRMESIIVFFITYPGWWHIYLLGVFLLAWVTINFYAGIVAALTLDFIMVYIKRGVRAHQNKPPRD